MNLLFRFRQRYGMFWKSSFPWIELMDKALTVLITLAFIALLLAVYCVVDANERAAEERIKTSQAEQMVNDCLHHGAVFVVDGRGAKCRIEWIKL